MHDSFNLVALQNIKHPIVVTDIALFENRSKPQDLFQTVQYGGVAIGEIVENDNFMAALSHGDRGMRADKAGSARQ